MITLVPDAQGRGPGGFDPKLMDRHQCTGPLGGAAGGMSPTSMTSKPAGMVGSLMKTVTLSRCLPQA